jgi:hypothetical protein
MPVAPADQGPTSTTARGCRAPGAPNQQHSIDAPPGFANQSTLPLLTRVPGFANQSALPLLTRVPSFANQSALQDWREIG